jgi:hypothetical protein
VNCYFDCDTDNFETQAFGVRPTTYGDEYDIGLELMVLPTMTVVCPRWNKTDLKTTDRLLLPVLSQPRDHIPIPFSHALMDRNIENRKDAQIFFIGASTAKELDEGNFGAQTASHATHL